MGGSPWEQHVGQSVFIPARYILALVQVILNGICYKYPEPYLREALPFGNYEENQTSLRAVVFFTLFFTVGELMLFVMGYSLYQRGLQLTQTVVHFFGALFSLFVVLSGAHYYWWSHFLLYTAIVPFLMQVFCDATIFAMRFA
ncbi:unnamed protein product [Amoebophrya sp. A120]|nr:unnamed protein product [Amoebophrya sp. A120]|eukprot:GSA120T00015076001.1